MATPNASTVLHKISEIYDRIAFAAVGRYNEYEVLRKAGVTYADLTGYSFDRGDVTARGLANWYAQQLGTSFTESMKPYEVEIVVAEVGARPDDDQIYRISWDGSVSDEPGFVAFGGQADQVSAALKEAFSDNMSLTEALGAALAALTAPPAATAGRLGRRLGSLDGGQRHADRADRLAARDRDPRPRPRPPHVPPPAGPAPRGADRRVPLRLRPQDIGRPRGSARARGHPGLRRPPHRPRRRQRRHPQAPQGQVTRTTHHHGATHAHGATARQQRKRGAAQHKSGRLGATPRRP